MGRMQKTVGDCQPHNIHVYMVLSIYYIYIVVSGLELGERSEMITFGSLLTTLEVSKIIWSG